MSAFGLCRFLFSGIAIAYLERVVISQSMPAMAAELNLTTQQQGWLFSAFSWGYVAGMIPGGFLARKLDGRFTFTAAVVLSSGLAGVASILHSFQSLFLTRLCLGIAEAPLFPSAAMLVREYLPLATRGMATGLFDAGSYIGAASVGMALPWAITRVGWRMSMIGCPLICVLWLSILVRFNVVAFIRGQSSPRSSVREATFKRNVLPKLILFSALFAMYNFIKSFFLTWFPTLLHGESPNRIGWLTVISMTPFLIAIIGEIGMGALMDWLIRRGVGFGKVRRYALVAGFCGAAIIPCFGFTENRGVQLLVAVSSFTALISMSAALWVLPGDMVRDPKETSLYGAAMNSVANVGGIASPIVIGSLLGRGASALQTFELLSGVAITGAFLSLGVFRERSSPSP